ncbi:MAG: autotransporter outer membrane beta-barrel domain-containing protein [Paracoccaceae bacterium]
MTGGDVTSLDQGAGFDTAVISGGRIIGLFTDGDDATFTGGRIGSVDLGPGNNTFGMSGTARIDTLLNSEQGNDTFSLNGGSVGGVLSSGSGNDVVTLDGAQLGDHVILEGGDDTLRLRSGTVAGSIFMDAGPGHNNGSDGSDNATLYAGFNLGLFAGTIDGGDDVSAADGLVDTVTFQGASGMIDGSRLQNWERVVLNGAAMSLGPGLTTGSGFGTGLRVTNGSVLNAAGGFSLTGDLANTATLSARDGTAGDVVSVTGDYSGGGRLRFDVDFASDTADRLSIGGNVTASGTAVSVSDVSTGAPSGRNVLVVDVAGITAAGDFTLAGGPITSGAFTYDLALQGSSWFLTSAVNPTGSVYEVVPFVLGALVNLPTHEQRLGQRQHLGAGEDLIEGGSWIRAQFSRFDVTPTRSSGGSSFDGTSGGIQFGYDVPAEAGDRGQWVFGLTGEFGTVRSAVANATGGGHIDGTGFGLGATATWYGHDGTYFDAQATVGWLEGDYSANGAPLASDADAKGKGVSVELGRRLGLNARDALVPQVQFSWSQIDGERFRDSQGSLIDLGRNERLIGRLGLAYERHEAAPGGGKFYAIGNLLRDLSDSSVDVAGASLTSRVDDTWVEIGLGGSKVWDENRRLYAEASYRRSLGGASGSGLGLVAGLEVAW